MEATLDYRIYKHYSVEEKIGRGSYGEVYKAVHKKTKKVVAIKKIIDAFQNITDAKRTFRQLSYLQQLSHPCIISLNRILTLEKSSKSKSRNSSNVYAVFQFMEFDLAKTIHTMHTQSRILQPIQRKYITLQILSAINYLHLSGLVHRDIKPSNILINTLCQVKLCDFGLVRMINASQNNDKDQIFTEYVASRWYRPPEIMINGNGSFSSSIDLWSVGCVLAQLVLNQPIFPGKSTIDQLQKIFSVIGMPSLSEIDQLSSQQSKFLLRNFQPIHKVDARALLCNASQSQFDLISKLLKFDPSKRITVREALNHSYFDEVRDLASSFHSIPSKVTDYSLGQHKEKKIEDYRILLQNISADTFREEISNNSKDFIIQHNEKSEQIWFQEKSTRQSNCGRLQKYQNKYVENINKQKREKGPSETSLLLKKRKSVSTKGKRSKSKQSRNKTINNSKKKNNSNHSSKSQLKIVKNSTIKIPKPTQSQFSSKQRISNNPSQLKKKKKDKFSTTNLNKFLSVQVKK